MDSWRIDNPHLLGSRNPTLADLEQLRRDGFEVLISLLQEDEQSPRYDVTRAAALGFRRHNIPVKDFCPPTVVQLEHFLSLIGDARGAKTIVHCEGGSGRTGTFAAAYWVARGLNVSDAITRVREARRHAVETPEQEAILKDFAAQHMGSVCRQLDLVK
jgi:protein-tyrosine phosphatase